MKLENKVQKIEINDKEYEVATRTAIVEEKIKKHDELLPERTEYINNKELIEIIIGEDAFKEIFPNGENENLDNISKVAYACIECYYKDKADAEMSRAKKSINDLNKLKVQNRNVHPALKKK